MNQNISITLTSMCILSSFLLQCTSPRTSPQIVKEPDTAKLCEYISINELNKMTSSQNDIKPAVNIRGIVKKKFICPPCPEGYDCEKCPDDHIVVSDGMNDVMLVCNPKHFILNTEYCFSLERKKYENGYPYFIKAWKEIPGKPSARKLR